LLALAASAVALTAGSASTAPRFQVLAHVDPKGGYSGDVVGERHYAYLSSRRGETDCPAQGVRVYDLSKPREPRHIATFADGASTPELADSWTEKTIVRPVRTNGFDGVLAVTSVQACGNGFGGFALYDVTNPASPQRLALVRTQPRGSHEIWLATARGHAWVYTALASAEFAAEPDQFGFHIFDVTHPRTPHEVGGWSACRDLQRCTPIGGAPYFVHSVIANTAATRAFLSYWNLGTVILDISNPARPRYLGRTRPGQGNVHSAWLADHGRLLLETHETPNGRVSVWNVAHAAHPRFVSALRLPARLRPGGSFTGRLNLVNSAHDPKAVEKLAYVSWYGQGVAVFDLSRPAKPRFVTRFRPPPEPDEHALLCPGRSCTAVWGVFPMRRYVLASDMSSGLWVLSRPR
jgi:hypothetical protein